MAEHHNNIFAGSAIVGLVLSAGTLFYGYKDAAQDVTCTTQSGYTYEENENFLNGKSRNQTTTNPVSGKTEQAYCKDNLPGDAMETLYAGMTLLGTLSGGGLAYAGFANGVGRL